MSDIINFNGTIEGLGGPFIGVHRYKRVIFIYYRRGTRYSIPTGEDEKGVMNYNEVVIDSIDKIKAGTPISKIEVRYIRAGDFDNVDEEKIVDFEDLEVYKTGGLTTTKSKAYRDIRSVFWIPIGLGNILASWINYGEDYLKGVIGDYWNLIPATIKPVIVQQEQQNASSYITQGRRTLDDNNASLIKESEFYSISKKQDTLTVTLFSVKSNLILDILLGYLEYWMNCQKEAQTLGSRAPDGTTQVFPDYKDYPDEKNAWDLSNPKYFIRRKYVPGADSSYLFSYINDSIFFMKGKLTGYSTNPSSNGDGITLTINFERVTTEEETWIYEKQKGNRKVKPEPVKVDGDLSLTSSENMCKIDSFSTNNITKDYSKSINAILKGK